MTVLAGYQKREYGSEYESVKGKTKKEIAKIMRGRLKVFAGVGAIPEDWQYSVRVNHGSSIDIKIVIPDELNALLHQYEESKYAEFGSVWSTFAVEHGLVGEYLPLKEVVLVRNFVQSVHDSFNYNNSDYQTDYFDVNFYGGVSVISKKNYEAYYK